MWIFSSEDNDERDRAVFVLRDRSEGLLIDDPTLGTTRVELFDADGLVLVAEVGVESAGAWSLTGVAKPKWIYRDVRDPDPPDGVKKIYSSRS